MPKYNPAEQDLQDEQDKMNPVSPVIPSKGNRCTAHSESLSKIPERLAIIIALSSATRPSAK